MTTVSYHVAPKSSATAMSARIPKTWGSIDGPCVRQRGRRGGDARRRERSPLNVAPVPRPAQMRMPVSHGARHAHERDHDAARQRRLDALDLRKAECAIQGFTGERRHELDPTESCR